MLLHDAEELDDDLGAGPDHDLALAGLLGVVDVLESIVQNRSANHLGCVGRRFSNRSVEMRYLASEVDVSPRGSSMESALPATS